MVFETVFEVEDSGYPVPSTLDCAREKLPRAERRASGRGPYPSEERHPAPAEAPADRNGGCEKEGEVAPHPPPHQHNIVL